MSCASGSSPALSKRLGDIPNNSPAPCTPIVNRKTVQCSAVTLVTNMHSAVKFQVHHMCSALQYSALHGSVLHGSVLHGSAVQCNAVQSSAAKAVHCSAVQCSAILLDAVSNSESGQEQLTMQQSAHPTMTPLFPKLYSAQSSAVLHCTVPALTATQ